ncbi:cation efflux family protein [Actinidia rufa]|uniref:Cation efflux family protein n=1 Tax=Actinidia rufa TaxID=165716 RepID=A0A7J0GSB5_9ERIC|nr:cation efflux family protein [Actinidia rufa]
MGFFEFFNLNPLPTSQDFIVTTPYHKIFKPWHVGGHSHHRSDRSSNDGEKVFRLGLAADIGLDAGKAFTGYLTGNTAIIADAAHSISDVAHSHKNLHLYSHNRFLQALVYSQFPLYESPNHKIFKQWYVCHSHHDRVDLVTAARRYSGWDLLPTLAWLPEKHSLVVSPEELQLLPTPLTPSRVVLSGVALLSFKAAKVPKDKERPYSHF